MRLKKLNSIIVSMRIWRAQKCIKFVEVVNKAYWNSTDMIIKLGRYSIG